MTWVMYDSTEVAAIPVDATAVMGYIGPVQADNRFVTFPELVRLFPYARKVSIATHPELDAEGLDVERFDAGPTDFPGWWRRMMGQHRYRPFVYASRDAMGPVIALMSKDGIARGRYRLLSAHYGVGAHICSPSSCGANFTADGTQWTDTALGRSLDESLLASDWFPSSGPKRPKVHPKVKGATAGAALMAGIEAVLHAAGVKLSPAESSAIATVGAALGGYVTPSGRAAP